MALQRSHLVPGMDHLNLKPISPARHQLDENIHLVDALSRITNVLDFVADSKHYRTVQCPLSFGYTNRST